MLRRLALPLLVAAFALLAPRNAEALVGASLKLGGGFIPDGKIPGGVLAADVGPLGPFAEVFRESGVTKLNLGGNLLLKLPLPVVRPYGGVGGGVTRTSGDGFSSNASLFLDVIAGADLRLPGTASFFGHVKYYYSFESGIAELRDVAFQAGLVIHLGI